MVLMYLNAFLPKSGVVAGAVPSVAVETVNGGTFRIWFPGRR